MSISFENVPLVMHLLGSEVHAKIEAEKQTDMLKKCILWNLAIIIR